MFGCVQLASIFLSLASLFFSVLHFNSLEARRLSVRGAGKLLLGLGYFAATIVFRALGLALALCFLGWWAATLIFLLFFTTVLTALCIGDNILRACVYGFWSFLVPVGYARDPTEPLDYNILYTKGERHYFDFVNVYPGDVRDGICVRLRKSKLKYRHVI